MLSAALLLIVICEVALGRDVSNDIDTEMIYPLDMALDSVDDQFDGCSRNMAHQVETRYLNEEITADISGFGEAWRDGEENHVDPQDNLTENHLIAIFVYTCDEVYADFNNDVRNGRQAYQSLTFRWYSLHFLLTEAIQILKQTQQGCRLTYRGTDVEFNVLNEEIRFGSFASSSLDQNEAKEFGNRSCFEIYTCHGADVTQYSYLPDESEVLIPPYEKFKITDIRNNQNGDWCETVYVLKSSGIQSDLNCEVAALDSLKYHRSHSLSRHYIRKGKIMSRRPLLSDPYNSRFRLLRVKQRIESKIFHQYWRKGIISQLLRK